MHRACPWDMRQPRVMYHARIAGDPTIGVRRARLNAAARIGGDERYNSTIGA